MPSLNECEFRAVSGGLGDFVVSEAITGFYTPEQCIAPVVMGDVSYAWRAESNDLTQYELFRGAYDSGTNTVARTTILQSSNAGAKVNFTASPRVRQVPLAQDFEPLSVEVHDAVNTAVSSAAQLTHTTSGTPTAGIGTSLNLAAETSPGNTEVIGTIQAVTTIVTLGFEHADMIFDVMRAGTIGGEEVFRITSAGKFLIGGDASPRAVEGIIPMFQITSAGTEAALTCIRYTAGAAAGAARTILAKSRGSVFGDHATVVDGDALGEIYFAGSEGTVFTIAASIRGDVDGVPAANSVPGRLSFRTNPPSVAGTPTERMRLDNTTTATHTSMMLFDVDNNTVERVTVGIADSGGAGFKVLRIPN